MRNIEAEINELRKRQEEYFEGNAEYWVIERQIEELMDLAVTVYGYEFDND